MKNDLNCECNYPANSYLFKGNHRNARKNVEYV